MEMRRKDLAVTDPAKIDAIIQGCDCIRLAFADGTHPYIVPLSFGYVREGDTAKFYFHGAANGRKVDLSRKLAYAGFELDRNRTLKTDPKACDFSFAYESVVGRREHHRADHAGGESRRSGGDHGPLQWADRLGLPGRGFGPDLRVLPDCDRDQRPRTRLMTRQNETGRREFPLRPVVLRD